MKLEILILAAGQGKRMHSALPKMLHDLGGRPLLAHALAVAEALHPAAVHVVYGHGGEAVRTAFAAVRVRWVHQAEQHGTGHAVQLAIAGVDPGSLVLVLYGDVPLITTATLRALCVAAGPDRVALLTADLKQPGHYGRILRDSHGKVLRIVEHKDAAPAETAITEINTGFLAAPAARLGPWLAKLTRANAQGEYYLTDIIGMAVAEGVTVATHRPAHAWEILGVNSREELAHVERVHQQQQAETLMRAGVTLRDPARFDLRGELQCGRDVVIDVNVIIEGKVELGAGVRIGPNNVICDARIGAGTVVQPNCVIEQAVVGRDCRIGPFARLRPGADIGDGVHIGNFVEIKKSTVGAGSKVNHLAYVGDATIGKDVNVGAGTITCNYDGASKHQTVIEDRAFIGSNTALVAPVTVGADATIGAGSVIAKDAPAGELTLTRAEQRSVKGWKRPVKKK
ncbi:MAG TPA: bifunctional UDP-N-acetylglucosamine diphosphorylase/glucosamine-1-phosphate N-acetyltransferase GlmU [Burkholderiales bacterium]|nr:bifunctional UDP-N-acetylglucosamine diphosphorylase/glucosamine-1-phosphate N-acetyltransferase GlmU [Burkholderiales bacterium]